MQQITRILLAVFALLCTPMSSVADVITLRADDWCPYNCDPASTRPGYMIEIAQRVFQRAGHQVDYQYMPWARTLAELAAGSIDGAVGVDPNEGGNLVLSPLSLGQSDAVFLVRAGDPWRYQGINSLANVRLGAILGYSYDDDIDHYILSQKNSPGRITLATGDEPLSRLLKMLVANRVDVVIEDSNVVQYQIMTLGLGGNIDEAGRLPSTPVYIAFSPAKPTGKDYARLLSEGLVELRASGELAQIMARYGLSDWAQNEVIPTNPVQAGESSGSK